MKKLFDFATKEIEELQKSLVYKMSLGSKELYHSNVWTWLIRQDPAFAKAFIPDIDDNIIFDDVSREERHRDLTIWYNMPDGSKQFYIIENKLKSIPHINQLEEYTKDAGDNMIGGVLTGLSKPVIMDGKDIITVNGKNWHFVPYSTLSKKMKEIADTSESPEIKKSKEIIDEYLNNNELVEIIVMSELDKDSLKQRWNNNWNHLNDLGLVDLINKLSGSRLVNYVRQRLEEDKINLLYLELAEGFHNKKVTLDFRLTNWYDYKEKNHNYLKIGVQIEGNQYRRMIDRNDSFCSANEIFEEFVEKGFFAQSVEKGRKKEKSIHFPNDEGNSRPTNMNKSFDKYGPTCIYQYSTLYEEDLEFENLYQRIKKDILLSEKLMIENNTEPCREKMK